MFSKFLLLSIIVDTLKNFFDLASNSISKFFLLFSCISIIILLFLIFLSISSVKKSNSPPSISHKIVVFEKSISDGNEEKKLSLVT